METNEYLLAGEKAKFCLKRLQSFKLSRWLSPFAYLFINYLFIFALFGFDNYHRTLIIYIAFSVLTSLATFLITSAAIKRYSNIINEIRINENGRIEINTLVNNTI